MKKVVTRPVRADNFPPKPDSKVTCKGKSCKTCGALRKSRR